MMTPTENHKNRKPLFTPAWVARVLGTSGASLSDPSVPFASFSTDSRKIEKGSLFIPLSGDTFDGHAFIDQALEQGASGILYEPAKWGRKPKTPVSAFLFEVEDSLKAYRKLAGAWRQFFQIPVVVVAGSAGKTTTKEFLAALLQGKWPNVLKTERSQNGFVGIALTLLELRPEHQAAVIEVGIDALGSMNEHLELIQPNASLVTMIGPEHLEFLKDIPTVAREEGEALRFIVQHGGQMAINLDDPWLKPYAHSQAHSKDLPIRRTGFTLGEPEQGAYSDLNLVTGKVSSDGEVLAYQGTEIPTQNLSLPLPGKHNATNLLGAVTVALGLGLTPQEIRTGIEKFTPAEGRSQVKTLKNGLTVICDYYNAQPMAMQAGLGLLGDLGRKNTPRGKTWACIADMLELGTEEEKYHRDLAPTLLEHQIDHAFLLGTRMRFLEDELKHLRYPGDLRIFTSHAEMSAALLKETKPHDTVLIKGSKSMKMDKIWKELEKS